MKKKIVIGGYYGYGSLGDEAVLGVLLSELREKYPQYELTVLCASPGKMKEIYNVECIHRYDTVAIIRAFSNAELYISGGGSLIQDSTSRRSLGYYTGLIHLAKALGAKVYAYANGIGPIKNTRAAVAALSKCDAISVRDECSHQLLTELSIPSYLSVDPFLLCEPAGKYRVRRFLSDRGIHADRYFTVSLRRCRGQRQINEDALLHCLLPVIIEGCVPIFVSMQDRCDLALCAAMADMTGGYVVSPTDATILLGLQRDAEFAIGMRLHFLLAAVCMGTPVTALSYDMKVRNVLKYTADIDAHDAFSFDPQLIANTITAKHDYSLKLDTMRSLALSDIDTIGQLLAADQQLVKA